MDRYQEVQLIKSKCFVDAIGQEIETSSEVSVFCEILSVSQNEFFCAGQSGYKPAFKVIMWEKEYDDEKYIKISGNIYSIYRTYQKGDGMIELYVESRNGNNGGD